MINFNSRNLNRVLNRLSIKINLLFKSGFLFFINIYKIVFSPIFGGSCRFEPSCSNYSIQAFKNHGVMRALKLTITRILKCRPGGPFGFDPVPECECDNGR